MIKEIIQPKEETYILHIPKEYINKEIEVVLKPKDEDLVKETVGLLKELKIDPLKWQEEIRSEWER